MNVERVAAAVENEAAMQQSPQRGFNPSQLPVLTKKRRHGRKGNVQHQRQPSKPDQTYEAYEEQLHLDVSPCITLPPRLWNKFSLQTYQQHIREVSLMHQAQDISDSETSSDSLSRESSPRPKDDGGDPATPITEISTGSPLPLVSLHKVKRIQLLNGLYENLGDKPRLVMETPTMRYFREVAFSSPALQAAVDAFCNAEIASRHDSPQHSSQARAAYGAAMTLIGAELAAGGNNTSRERKMSNLACIALLVFCATFSGVEGPTMSARARVAGVSHMIGGAQYLLTSCKPESIVTRSDWVIFQAFRHAGFCLSLHQSIPEWFVGAEWIERCKTRDNSQFLPRERYTLLLHDRLAGLLKLLKQLSSITVSSAPTDQSLRIYQKASKMRESLRDWTSQQFVELGNAGYDLVDLAELPHFASVYDKDKTFPRVYQFHTQWTAIDYVEMWFACLLLDEQRMLVLESGKIDLPSVATELEEMRWSLRTCARQICQTLPDALEKRILIPGYPHDFSLQVAKKILQRFNMFDELHWCYNVQSVWLEQEPPNG